MSKMYLIGNAHLDPVWLWRWQEGFSEILATYRSALDRMKDFPEFKFTSACSLYYEFIEKVDPAMFEEIKARVEEGRWNIVGGWVLQPDCNMPSGESFARHGLFGQRYFKEKFGRMATTAYNVDSFGHNASLPKIFRASGMENYVFMRPNMLEQGRTEALFNWEADDGSVVTAYRVPRTYCIKEAEVVREVYEDKRQYDNDFMVFYGVGNHGGGPTIKLINDINEMKLEAVHSTPDEYFALVDKESLPTLYGELQHHARGCYSVCARIKNLNRRSEQNLIAAEKLSVIAEKLTGLVYPKEKLDRAWKTLLFNQFHDILCGCCIKKAFDDAAYSLGETMSITEQVAYLAMQTIAYNIDTLGDTELPSTIKKNWKTWEHEVIGTPVVIFNPHAWDVRAEIVVNEIATKVTDADGNEVAFQKVRGDMTDRDFNNHHTAFMATVPALGYVTYSIFTEKPAEIDHASEMVASDDRLENSKIIVEFDRKTGDIARLYDKVNGRYIINKSCRALLLDETHCDTWAHNMDSLGNEVGAFYGAKIKLMESGDVRATVRTTAKYGSSTIRRDFTILAGDDRVYVKTKVDFHEKHKALKFAFPMSDEKIISGIAFGTVERPAYTGEEPCGEFVACGSLAVANDSKYGYDSERGELRMTVLRNAIYADHYGMRDEFCEFIEEGVHEFSYCVYPFITRADATKKAEELNFAPRIIMGSFHKGSLPKSFCGIECDRDDVIVTCVKRAEDTEDAVVRFYEAEGIDTDVSLTLFGKKIEAKISHNAIKTFTENGEEKNMLEM